MFILKTLIGIFLFVCIMIAAGLAITLFDNLVKMITAAAKKYPIIDKICKFIVYAFFIIFFAFIIYGLMLFCYQIGDKII